MLTTREVLAASDSVSQVFRVGMTNSSMTVEFVNTTNVAQLAVVILERQGEFIFKLTGVLLRGLTCLHCRKTTILLENCEEILSRISLRFQGESQAPKEKKANQRRNQKNTNENVTNIETIINEEACGNTRGQVEPIFEHSHRMATVCSPPEVVAPGNDFGDNPFILQTDACDWIVEDNDIHAPSVPDVDLDLATKGPIGAKCIVDAAPVFSMAQLSAMIQDTSATLLARPIRKNKIETDRHVANEEFEDQFREAKDLAWARRPTLKLRGIGDFSPVIPEDDENDIPAPDEQCDSDHPDDEAEKSMRVDIMPQLSDSLSRVREVAFTTIIMTRDRRELSLSFLAALKLQNRGIIRLHRSKDRLDVIVSRGSRFA